MNETITEFQDEYRWLSNFTAVNVTYQGHTYRTIEHAYMAAKVASEQVTFLDWNGEPRRWREWVRATHRAGSVKKMSRNIVLRKGWKTAKVAVMDGLLRQKFQQEPFRTMLLETGQRPIREGNRWGDTFWGIDLRTGKGENILGRLIMQIRTELQ